MNIPAASAAFSAHAPEYTALRRRLVPDFDAFYGTLLRGVGLAYGSVGRVLDLGAGTGLVAATVADAYPEAQFDLLDGSAEMLSEAQELLGERVNAVHVQDMAAGLPAGRFDAVVSALAIHHLVDADKEALYRRVFAALRPGGVFVNAEQCAGPTPEMTRFNVEWWVSECLAAGATQGEIDDAFDRRTHDRCTDVETQLGWLRAIGFTQVDCLYKRGERAVLIAVKGTSL
jgi:tRNA (cmo5U34)-methyltransferase